VSNAEHLTVISGVGQSDIGRRLNRDPLELTLDACLAAIDDAGLTTADIDGISTYPGATSQPPGFTGGGVVDVQDALRLDLGWFSGGLERPGQLGAVIDACLAVAFGLAKHVLCFRSVFEGSAQGAGGRAAVMPGGDGRQNVPRASGFMEWVLPYGAPSACLCALR
jgi:acetyl-CoA acetyltransferase